MALDFDFPSELRFTCYGDGNECEVMRELLDRFEADGDGITVVIDKVPYKAILESLPVQLAAGEGPDLARVTDLGGLNKYYLDISPHVDTAYWEDSFGATLKWYRGGPDDQGIYGMMTQLTSKRTNACCRPLITALMAMKTADSASQP